jgi:hypothetical protein
MCTTITDTTWGCEYTAMHRLNVHNHTNPTPHCRYREKDQDNATRGEILVHLTFVSCSVPAEDRRVDNGRLFRKRRVRVELAVQANHTTKWSAGKADGRVERCAPSLRRAGQNDLVCESTLGRSWNVWMTSMQMNTDALCKPSRTIGHPRTAYAYMRSLVREKSEQNSTHSPNRNHCNNELGSKGMLHTRHARVVHNVTQARLHRAI